MIQDVKTAVVVATGTTGAGVSSWLELIPNDIGKLATIAGIILSIVLIYSHIGKGRLERRKLELEIRKLEADK